MFKIDKKQLLRWAILALIVALAAYVRLSHLDLVEFKGDEARISTLARLAAEGKALPLVGNSSSIGTVNGAIFIGQGKALNAVASRNVKVLVVGNPANTNAYIAMKSAPDLPAKNFTAMLRLDHNRAASQLAAKTGKAVSDIEKLAVWGNHSPTMYADYRFATIGG